MRLPTLPAGGHAAQTVATALVRQRPSGTPVTSPEQP